MATLGEKLTDKPTASNSPIDEPSDDAQIWQSSYDGSTNGTPSPRLDFRLRDGRCISLLYRLLAEIQFETNADDEHIVSLDFTPFWHVTIHGSKLEEVYELLQTHSVWWMREGNPEEKEDGGAYIEQIDALKLTSPSLAAKELEHQLNAAVEE